VKTYLKMILVLVVNHYSAYLDVQETLQRTQRLLDRLAPLFEYLEEHYSEPVRVHDAAHVCAVSISHLMYFFREATGQSFLAYLNRFRVAKAQSLLISTEMPLAEISQATGFCDQSHFGQVFRKLVGLTPLTYRRRFSKPASLPEADTLEPAVPRDRRLPRPPAAYPSQREPLRRLHPSG
jgi:transcriptional regulator GlxA family with amidase domain